LTTFPRILPPKIPLLGLPLPPVPVLLPVLKLDSALVMMLPAPGKNLPLDSPLTTLAGSDKTLPAIPLLPLLPCAVGLELTEI